METFATTTIEISVILYQEDGHWIAQGLEFDITARGSSPPDASKRFATKVGAELVMSFELGDKKPLSGVAAAPQQFWQMFEAAEMCVNTDPPPIRVGDDVPRVRPRMRIAESQVAA